METKVAELQASQAFFDSSVWWDLFCRLVAAGFFVYLLIQNLLSVGTFVNGYRQPHGFQFWASVCAKSLVVIFVALNCILLISRRRPVKKTHGARPRVMALLGTFFFYLLAIPTGQPSLWQAIAGSLLLCAGTMMAVISVSRLGRSFSMMPEARKLITTGPYAIVRHPMYLSEQIAIAGIVVQNFSLYALALFTVHFWIQVQRMKHEENVLRNTFSEYDEVMGSRPRVIPYVY
jgi:protein-S-isoprenylcysteine O-methyltransferase Ste14